MTDELLVEIELKLSPIHGRIFRRLGKGPSKRDGLIWRIKKNDAVPFDVAPLGNYP